jgi:flagellar motor switch/type III secretory pathway protein FliN
MIEIRITLGSFEMTVADLLELQEGLLYRWQIEADTPLGLYVGDEKIAHARLISDSDEVYVKVLEVLES